VSNERTDAPSLSRSLRQGGGFDLESRNHKSQKPHPLSHRTRKKNGAPPDGCSCRNLLRLEDALVEISSMLNRLPETGAQKWLEIKVSRLQSFKAQRGGMKQWDAETQSLPLS